MKLYKYDHYNNSTGKLTDGEAELAIYVVQDDATAAPTNYTQIATGATEITDWHDYGINCVGKAANFMDWKCLRDVIRNLVEAKGGVEYATYVANLTTAEKDVAVIYVPTKVADKLGFGQLIGDSGGAAQALDHIDVYSELSAGARYKRYKEMVGYVYQWMGKNQALQAEDDVRVSNLKGKFIERGILTTTEDSVAGFEDWANATNDFAANGLKKKLDDAVWALAAGAPDNTDFCQAIVDCARDGKYPIP